MAGPYSAGPIQFESVSAVTATPSIQLGTRREEDGRMYVYVYNDGGTQISVGEGAVVSGLSGYSVTVSSTTMADYFCGVVHHATFTTATYGWLVARGNSKVKAPAGSIMTSGNLLCAGGDGRHALRVSANTDTLVGAVHGKCTVATASAGVGEGYVRCLFS